MKCSKLFFIYPNLLFQLQCVNSVPLELNAGMQPITSIKLIFKKFNKYVSPPYVQIWNPKKCMQVQGQKQIILWDNLKSLYVKNLHG